MNKGYLDYPDYPAGGVCACIMEIKRRLTGFGICMECFDYIGHSILCKRCSGTGLQEKTEKPLSFTRYSTPE